MCKDSLLKGGTAFAILTMFSKEHCKYCIENRCGAQSPSWWMNLLFAFIHQMENKQHENLIYLLISNLIHIVSVFPMHNPWGQTNLFDKTVGKNIWYLYDPELIYLQNILKIIGAVRIQQRAFYKLLQSQYVLGNVSEGGVLEDCETGLHIYVIEGNTLVVVFENVATPLLGR